MLKQLNSFKKHQKVMNQKNQKVKSNGNFTQQCNKTNSQKSTYQIKSLKKSLKKSKFTQKGT